MLSALFYGLLANSALLLGGLLGLWLNIGKRPLGLIMAFGAGVLISAVAYELILEAVRQAYGSGAVATGIFAGALTFFFMDRLIEKYSGSERITMEGSYRKISLKKFDDLYNKMWLKYKIIKVK